MNSREPIRHLISLLDDPDENVARFAMGELLQHPSALSPYLAEFQESSDPLLRRRGHQLQSTLKLRARRHQFLGLIEDPATDVIEGLIQVHLQWFDNDSEPGLHELWRDFSTAAAAYHPGTVHQLAYFMRKYPMQYAAETTMTPEFYCIGSILENKQGAGSMLAAIGAKLAELAGVRLSVVRVLGEFALLDAGGLLLTPRDNWQISDGTKLRQSQKWSGPMLLRYAANMLFSNAVNSDSFRYVHTIGQALTELPDGENLEFLPYPYSPPPEDEEEAGENPQ